MHFSKLAFLLSATLSAARPTSNDIANSLNKRAIPASIVWNPPGPNTHFIASSAALAYSGTAADNFALFFQTDGNLVFYHTVNNIPTALWNSNTAGADCSSGNCQAIFQTDGNFVIYHGSSAVFNTGTEGTGVQMGFHPTGSPALMLVRNAAGTVIYSTNPALVASKNAGSSGSGNTALNNAIGSGLKAALNGLNAGGNGLKTGSDGGPTDDDLDGAANETDSLDNIVASAGGVDDGAGGGATGGTDGGATGGTDGGATGGTDNGTGNSIVYNDDDLVADDGGNGGDDGGDVGDFGSDDSDA